MAEIHIGISGNISSGKTTLGEYLTTENVVNRITKNVNKKEVKFYHERIAENPYLPRFYKDMKRWAFESQMCFLLARKKLQVEIENNEGIAIEDRTLEEDKIFATSLHHQGILDDLGFKNYCDWHNILVSSTKRPDVMIYLRVPHEENLRKRIAKRGRTFEKGITEEYLKHLNGLYEEWINKYSSRKIIVNAKEELSDSYLESIVDKIETAFETINLEKFDSQTINKNENHLNLSELSSV